MARHYVNEVLDWLEEENIRIITRDKNQPNVPEICPDEHFWGIIQQRVNNWTAKDQDHLTWRICQKAREIEPGIVTSLFRGLRAKFRHANCQGLESLHEMIS